MDNYNHSKYETQPLQAALISAFSEKENLFGGPRPHTFATDVKVAVTATSATSTPVVFANYNRLCEEKLPYKFQRPERPDVELKIWEAARATSAAPRIFKPFHHVPSKQVYVDGAIYQNNPIEIADKERKLLWPSLAKEYPDVIVSIGTSYMAPGSSSLDEVPVRIFLEYSCFIRFSQRIPGLEHSSDKLVVRQPRRENFMSCVTKGRKRTDP